MLKNRLDKKMQRRVSLIFLVFLLSVCLEIISCNKDKTLISPLNKTAIKEFPNEIGNEWIYFYYDSLNFYADTVNVKIVGEIEFNGGRKAKIWEYHFKTKIDTKYVEISGDTVRIYDHLDNLRINTKYIFPLEVGKGWKGDFPNDSTSVIDKTSIYLNGMRFQSCYILKRIWGAVNNYGLVTTWFVPGVGVVKRHHLGLSFGTANVYWELLDYNIK